MNSLIGIAFAIALLQQPDHSPKPCVVKEVVTEGVRSDCHGWKPTNGEKMYAPAEVNKQLKVGDTFYFVWKKTRWVAQIAETVAVIVAPDKPAIIMEREEAKALFVLLCLDGTDDSGLRALAAALNPMPDWPQFVVNNEPSVCNRNPKSFTPIPPK